MSEIRCHTCGANTREVCEHWCKPYRKLERRVKLLEKLMSSVTGEDTAHIIAAQQQED